MAIRRALLSAWLVALLVFIGVALAGAGGFTAVQLATIGIAGLLPAFVIPALLPDRLTVAPAPVVSSADDRSALVERLRALERNRPE
jgi:hypothetical protein